RGRAGVAPAAPAIRSGAGDARGPGRRRTAVRWRGEHDVDASAVGSELYVIASDRVDHADERDVADAHRDGVAAVLELAGDVEKVAMARPLAECCPRVFLLFRASLLSGGAEDGLEVVERVIRRHAQRLREPVGRTVTPGGVAVPRLGEVSPA